MNILLFPLWPLLQLDLLLRCIRDTGNKLEVASLLYHNIHEVSFYSLSTLFSIGELPLFEY